MTILFIGDIFGQTGLSAVRKEVPLLKEEYDIDFVIANAENSSINGKGLSKKDYDFLMDSGVDFITLGNHSFRNRDIFKYIDDTKNIVRPSNWEGSDIPGVGTQVIKVKNKSIRISSIMGQTYLMEPATSPFKEMNEILEQTKEDIHIVDFHAEATSEKVVFGYKFDGLVTAVFGTHTHVQTNDLRINPKGTLYITDAGMTGSQYSAIGADLESVSRKMVSGLPSFFKESTREAQFNGILFQVDDKSNEVVAYEKIFINPMNPTEKQKEL